MSDPVPDSDEQRARRLELAKKAFRDFNAQCFWWYPLDFEVTEAATPMIVRELRAAGGHEGYRIVAELCR